VTRGLLPSGDYSTRTYRIDFTMGGKPSGAPGVFINITMSGISALCAGRTHEEVLVGLIDGRFAVSLLPIELVMVWAAARNRRTKWQYNVSRCRSQKEISIQEWAHENPTVQP
jgi:hypothetical protein